MLLLMKLPYSLIHVLSTILCALSKLLALALKNCEFTKLYFLNKPLWILHLWPLWFSIQHTSSAALGCNLRKKLACLLNVTLANLRWTGKKITAVKSMLNKDHAQESSILFKAFMTRDVKLLFHSILIFHFCRQSDRALCLSISTASATRDTRSPFQGNKRRIYTLILIKCLKWPPFSCHPCWVFKWILSSFILTGSMGKTGKQTPRNQDMRTCTRCTRQNHHQTLRRSGKDRVIRKGTLFQGSGSFLFLRNESQTWRQFPAHRLHLVRHSSLQLL